MEGLEASGYRHQAAHVHQHGLHVPPQQDGGAVDGREVVGVEQPGEEYVDFVAVEGEESAVKPALDYAAAEVGHIAQRVGIAPCGGVLQHHHAVAVVDVGKCEGFGAESVEE